MAHGRVLRTARLELRPVGWSDLAEVSALKRDPRVFAQMLGGVRTPAQATADMAEDVAFWGENGIGIFGIRERGVFRGITGFHRRPDGRGIGLRFAIQSAAHGRGLAREAAGTALRFAHDEGWPRIVAVCRADNRQSRIVLGSIGMTQTATFDRDGNGMLVYESLR